MTDFNANGNNGREDKNNGKKSWKEKGFAVLTAIALTVPGATVVGCDNTGAKPINNDPNTSNPPIEQPANPSTSEPAQEHSETDGNDSGSSPSVEQPAGNPELNGHTQEEYDYVESLIKERAEQYIAEGKATGYTYEIFPTSNPNGYTVTWTLPDGSKYDQKSVPLV
jgi:flagellar biosynthesis/type III secretory pathway protein FliH